MCIAERDVTATPPFLIVSFDVFSNQYQTKENFTK